MKKLRLILGDQLNSQHSWFDKTDDSVTYCMFEVRQETDYVRHHIQKVVAYFLSMRQFGRWLSEHGHRVVYYKLDDANNNHSLTDNLKALIEEQGIAKFEYQLPDEYRLDQQMKNFCDTLDIESEVFDTEHFLAERLELKTFFEGKKMWLMESFYRDIRKRYDIMMDGDKPVTGKWNYDEDNRKKLPRDVEPPKPKVFDKDVSGIVALLQSEGVETIGNIDESNFIWPTSREEAHELLDFFIKECLASFGSYQDAMTPAYWSLFHSRLSFSMNTKQLHPLEVVNAAVEYWQQHEDDISISQIEGFVRQIIGWREYMRGVYWAHMPDYADMNALDNDRPLPSWYWTGDTKMKCLSHSIRQSLDYAYAHHIQRLMVTGNFALLLGVDPDEVDEWYLGIYIDAIEWVEMPNTRGMSQFADGGIVGTKPYVSSANYIGKMSHYCKDCHYAKTKKTGEHACPFNSLYWHFVARNRKKLEKNPRIGMMYRTWDRMSDEKQQDLIDQAEYYIKHAEEL